jgi:hypothetical protein
MFEIVLKTAWQVFDRGEMICSGIERVGFDFSRAARSAAETPVDFAWISIRDAFWAFCCNSIVVNGILSCKMADNNGMQKYKFVGELEILVSDENVAEPRMPGEAVWLCHIYVSTFLSRQHYQAMNCPLDIYSAYLEM